MSLSSEHPNASPLLDRVKVLHRAVTEWEERSIRLVLAGDLDGAAKMLLADEYIRDRAAFRNSVDAAVRAIREDADLAMREDQRSEILSFYYFVHACRSRRTGLDTVVAAASQKSG